MPIIYDFSKNFQVFSQKRPDSIDLMLTNPPDEAPSFRAETRSIIDPLCGAGAFLVV